jgi:hypothetical protein
LNRCDICRTMKDLMMNAVLGNRKCEKYPSQWFSIDSTMYRSL